MFESAELGHTIDRNTYAKEAPKLRESLLEAQLELAETARFPVIILISGADGTGKREVVHLLNEWMDPRHIQTHAMSDHPTDEESERPDMWRFWRALPPKGKIGIFFGSWYTRPVLLRVFGKTKDSELDQSLDDIVRFEKMLTDEGALLLKFRLHLSKQRQQQRLRELENNPATRWRVTRREWEYFKHYDKFNRVTAHALRHTSSACAPWTVVEGTDERYRSLTVARVLLEAIRKRLDASAAPQSAPAAPIERPMDDLHLLRTLDLSQRLPKKTYAQELEKYQGRLNLLTRHRNFKKISVIAVFEGFDAAGKGGSIRRITGALDARQYQVIPIAAPTEEERAQPYLWRFWRHLPRRGSIAIFDRSWYGRVLVERVEGFCSVADWMRAYGEINDFEDQLIAHRTVLAKFWLSISQEEQLARFREREKTRFKRHKITAEDWRNREKWETYEQAVCDMVERTSTENAPWTLVEANDKYFARITILKTLCRRINAVL
ncbi:MAG TPA: polyphosphate:AMP phosphotransferase [Burkholderiales bacterium]|nr:polyphosphate:AMP phosphotransferase [Burkholderiales bacterium]